MIGRLYRSIDYRSHKFFRRATGFCRTLPEFAIIGAQKCGTSSLYSYLLQHPSVLPAFDKELHFFDRNEPRLNERERYRWWFPTAVQRAIVRRSRGSALCGEATPEYLIHPTVPRRVRDAVPDVKLIVLLRDPVDRAYSHYHHEVRKGREHLPFEKAIEQDPGKCLSTPLYSLCTHEFNDDWRYKSYLSRGRYAEQLSHWLEYFPRSQLLVLRSENFFADTQRELQKVLRFLGLRSHQFAVETRYNYGEYTTMEPDIRETLHRYYHPCNRDLRNRFGVYWE